MQFTLLKAKNIIELGKEIGRGGEGNVYSIKGNEGFVAKIYSKPPDSQKIKKIERQAAMATPALLKISAWPTDLLMDSKGTVRGFSMPRIVARRDVHELYSPKSRSEAFPEADFRFIVRVATNIARAFAVVHDHGHILGDVNHGNLLVGPDATVILIDCDSFQVQSSDAVFTCDVGVPLFTPPELQNHRLKGVSRKANHDNFGLAVLLFHLLYMGRHPFAGRFRGAGEMTIERAISEYRFAYGADQARHEMERPPGTLPLSAMGNRIATNFELAFSHDGTKGQRPDARSWLVALEDLEAKLQKCAANSRHHFFGSLSSCPWCTIEAHTSVKLFGQRIMAAGPTGTINIDQLWQMISSVKHPDPELKLPSSKPWSVPKSAQITKPFLVYVRKIFALSAILLGMAGCSAAYRSGGVFLAIVGAVACANIWPKAPEKEMTSARDEFDKTKRAWEAALSRWQAECSDKSFYKTLSSLEKARLTLIDMPNERTRRYAKLDANREQSQRQRYLNRFRIDRAKIPGIGPGRTSMLSSYGIETAADIEQKKILQIPGFGDALTRELVEWRKGHQRKFVFNPSEPINPQDIKDLENELAGAQSNALAALTNGARALNSDRIRVESNRLALMPVLEKTWNDYKIAEARHAMYKSW